MHRSALELGQLFFETYCNTHHELLIGDIGAQDVNGSLKSVIPPAAKYIGIDFVEAPGVDVVLEDPYTLPFEDGLFDALVCSSCFEHSEFFWLLFLEMMRVVKPGGLIYVNAPSNGYVHRYPTDSWRFYPDAGNALVSWGKRNGYEASLVESFIADQREGSDGAWNDFVAVIQKSENILHPPSILILDKIAGFSNGWRWDKEEIIEPHFLSQDHRIREYHISLIIQANERIHKLEASAQEFSGSLQLREQQISILNETIQKNKISMENISVNLEESFTRINDQNKTIAEKNALIELVTQIASYANELKIKQKGEIDALTSNIDKIFSSTSWRITAPLRALKPKPMSDRKNKHKKVSKTKFNAAWYLERYPDVALSNMDPYDHYMYFGKQEARLPAPDSFFQKNINRVLFLTNLMPVAKKNAGGILPISLKILSELRHSGIAGIKRRALALNMHIEVQAQRQGKSPQHYRFDAAVSGAQTSLFDITEVPPFGLEPPGSIGIHAHLFYSDLTLEFAEYLGNMPYPYDLYVSVANQEGHSICKLAFENLPNLRKLEIRIVENIGRDIAPMLCTFGKDLMRYEFISHIQGKKSVYNSGATDGWREYMMDGVLGSSLQIRRIFSVLTSPKKFGVVYPQAFHRVPYMANTWLANKGLAQQFAVRVGIDKLPQYYFDFPVGSIFWARTAALRPLFDANLKNTDFPPEQGQKDGTLAHVIERMLGVVPNSTGFSLGVLRDATHHSFSTWRLEAYLHKTIEHAFDPINSRNTQLIVFDVFDTLVTRPMIEPDHIKEIVTRSLHSGLALTWLKDRPRAENSARINAGRDIDLHAIYDELKATWIEKGIPTAQLEDIKALEIKMEISSISLRKEALEIFRYAIATGKKVVLASDMFLPLDELEPALNKLGIIGYERFFLSSNTGVRKDTGQLYEMLSKEYSTSYENMLIFGDNERSDVQIPGDMGCNFFHLLRPMEIARATSRLNPIINSILQQPDLDAELSIGLIIKRHFSALFYPGFQPENPLPSLPASQDIGYTIGGPLGASFAQWLLDQASHHKITKFFFIAREGKILKRIYDAWTVGVAEAPTSDYLILSRRAITVAMIKDMDDIEAIASKTYFRNRTEFFLKDRFGIELNDTEWEELRKSHITHRDEFIEVNAGDIRHIRPLLQALATRIFRQAAEELPGLLTYLANERIADDSSFAVVDVGYAGTIQARLCELTNQKIHGLYMATTSDAKKVASTYDVIAKGCFAENIEAVDAEKTPIIAHGFQLEKLLSSNDGQILRYIGSSPETIKAEFKQLSNEEQDGENIRAPMQSAILDYIADAVELRKLVPGFSPSLEVSRELFARFVKAMPDRERQTMQEIALDDHYCGRGVVR